MAKENISSKHEQSIETYAQSRHENPHLKKPRVFIMSGMHKDALYCNLFSPHKSLNVICNPMDWYVRLPLQILSFLLNSRHNMLICKVFNFTYLRKFYFILRALIIFISKKSHFSSSWWVEIPFIPEIRACKKPSEQVKIEHILQEQTQANINFMSLCYMTIEEIFNILINYL